MSQRTQDQLTAIYVLFLVVFGLGLILGTIWLFCTLSSPDAAGCVVDAISPF